MDCVVQRGPELSMDSAARKGLPTDRATQVAKLGGQDGGHAKCLPLKPRRKERRRDEGIASLGGGECHAPPKKDVARATPEVSRGCWACSVPRRACQHVAYIRGELSRSIRRRIRYLLERELCRCNRNVLGYSTCIGKDTEASRRIRKYWQGHKVSGGI